MSRQIRPLKKITNTSLKSPIASFPRPHYVLHSTEKARPSANSHFVVARCQARKKLDPSKLERTNRSHSRGKVMLVQLQCAERVICTLNVMHILKSTRRKSNVSEQTDIHNLRRWDLPITNRGEIVFDNINISFLNNDFRIVIMIDLNCRSVYFSLAGLSAIFSQLFYAIMRMAAVNTIFKSLG